MRAMVLSRVAPAEERPLRIAERPEPKAGPGEVVIEVACCGVCRTDLHIVEGEVEACLPVVPGHQAAGRVAEAGPGLDRFSVGDPVGVGWLHRTCGKCPFCCSGRENLCRSGRYTGRDADGGYAERLLADARFVYRLPARLPPGQAAPLLCAGIIGYRSLRLSEIEPGGRLGLFGFGASAHLALQVARHWGCEVYVFTRSDHHRRLATDLGAAWTGDALEDPGYPLDAAVIFAPAGELIPKALERLDRGRVLAVNAIHMSAIPSFEYDALYWERTVRSVANFTRQDAEEFLKLAADIPVRAEVERFPLEEANEALVRLKRGQIRGAAVLDLARR